MNTNNNSNDPVSREHAKDEKLPLSCSEETALQHADVLGNEQVDNKL
jgi:hypothetical protein